MNGIRNYKDVSNEDLDKLRNLPLDEQLLTEEFLGGFYHPLAFVEGSVNKFRMPDYDNETIHIYFAPKDCPPNQYHFPQALGDANYFGYIEESSEKDTENTVIYFKTEDLRKKLIRQRRVEKTLLSDIQLVVANDIGDEPPPKPFLNLNQTV